VIVVDECLDLLVEVLNLELVAEKGKAECVFGCDLVLGLAERSVARIDKHLEVRARNW
jgi:hypothetical protein